MKLTEGYVDFMGLKTWYRISGECAPGRVPLLALHGGPGSSHSSLEMLDPLTQDGRAVILYDQIGCGNSPAPGRTELFNREVWTDELENLRRALGLETVHLLGHSWGGMLLLNEVCTRHPKGLKSLILSSTLPDSQLWGREQHRMIRFLPQELQDAIARAEETGDYHDEAYQQANDVFMLRHCGPHWGEDAPECLRRPRSGHEAYVTGWGPNEFTPIGNLSDFNVTDRLSAITQPTLVLSGVDDLCTPLIAKTMADRIPGARWHLFENCRHMAYAEDPAAYQAVVGAWLREHDE